MLRSLVFVEFVVRLGNAGINLLMSNHDVEGVRIINEQIDFLF